jgi:TetR/AcrR family transcriptional repressor of bet genes
MPRTKKKSVAKSPLARSTHSRQHQLLIDACISALHLYGPSRTTVQRVVAIAKMSPGIVRFYFASKAAMLVQSLQFLAAEFEERLMVPVGRLKANPVAALRLLIDLYLDPEIASPRKVSVWYSFWGEASSRQEYYDICGQKDESFAALVRELIERMIRESGQAHLDADAVALGLIGVLEVLWQDFAFNSEEKINRPAATRRALAYLASVFPEQFSAPLPAAGAPFRPAPWVYSNRRLFELERGQVFRTAWQFVAQATAIPQAGDYLAADLGTERVLLVRDSSGMLRAFRNNCPAAPHTLVPPGQGRLQHIACPIHGVQFSLDGSPLEKGGIGLTGLDLDVRGELVLVRSAGSSALPAGFADWRDIDLPRARALETRERIMSADWKLVVEQWLEGSGDSGAHRWSHDFHARLSSGSSSREAWQQFLAPNHWLDVRADGFTLLQLLPRGPGETLLRQHHFTWCPSPEQARAARYLAARLSGKSSAAFTAMAESAQSGLALGYPSSAARSPATHEFHRQLLSLLSAYDSPRPSPDL